MARVSSVRKETVEARDYMRSYYLSHNGEGREREAERGAGREKKQCRRCKEVKGRADFTIRKSGPRAGQFTSYCAKCSNELRVERAYGVTQADVDMTLEMQHGACKLCGTELLVGYKATGPRKMVIDHDHETGRARGILCGKCNTAIGMLNDDPELLERAVDYLRNSQFGDRHE